MNVRHSILAAGFSIFTVSSGAAEVDAKLEVDFDWKIVLNNRPDACYGIGTFLAKERGSKLVPTVKDFFFTPIVIS